MLKKTRKLSLRRQTLRELTSVQLHRAIGGVTFEKLYIRDVPPPPPEPMKIVMSDPMSGGTQGPTGEPDQNYRG